MYQNTQGMVKDIQSNIEKLVAAYEAKAARCETLEKELAKCRNAEDTYKKRITELEDRVDNLDLKSVFSYSGTDNSRSREAIDSLIKEIDAALALLQ